MRRSCVHSSAKTTLLLLAPENATELDRFENVIESQRTYATLLSSLQRARGQVYVAEGAITPSSLMPDGRHVQSADLKSWHLLSVDASGTVLGCIRFHQHPASATFHSTEVSRSALAQQDRWATFVRKAVEAEIKRARHESKAFAEAGGWAISEQLRHSPESIRIGLGAFCVAKLTGGAVALSTATMRHKSAKILQRLGGSKLKAEGVELPRYFDPAYGCEMEILSFTDDTYSSGYHDAVMQLTNELAKAPVIVPRRPMWHYHTSVFPGVYAQGAVYA